MFEALKKIKSWEDVLTATHLDDIVYTVLVDEYIVHSFPCSLTLTVREIQFEIASGSRIGFDAGVVSQGVVGCESHRLKRLDT